MHKNDINRLSDLLEGFIWHHCAEMDSDNSKDSVNTQLLVKALEIINENL